MLISKTFLHCTHDFICFLSARAIPPLFFLFFFFFKLSLPQQRLRNINLRSDVEIFSISQQLAQKPWFSAACSGLLIKTYGAGELCSSRGAEPLQPAERGGLLQHPTGGHGLEAGGYEPGAYFSHLFKGEGLLRANS